MSHYASISGEKLWRLIGRPDAPVLIDLRLDADFVADPRLVPGSQRRSIEGLAHWGPGLRGRSVVAICAQGHKISHGAAAWLRAEGVQAEALEGGAEAWATADRPMVPQARLPERDARGRTLWVTRARPKIDRIACPWLIRRFVDPQAVFLFVPPAEALGVAERLRAVPFDLDAPIEWTHRGDLCSFETMCAGFGLGCAPLERLGVIVRGADTGRFDLAPEAAGLLALSLGLSRMHADDLAQLEAGLPLYDAIYRWCRDAVDETHGWPTAGQPA